MENIPKIVRQRLRAATPAVNHPDANVLTAFTERSLPEVERAIVVEHLACCHECRDIVAIAFPPAEAAETVTVPARTRWLTWPALRWGLAAAGLIVVASVGIVQIQRASRQPTTTVAKETRSENSSGYVQVPASSPATAAPAIAAPSSEADRTAADAKTRFIAPSGGTAGKLAEPKLTVLPSPPPLHRPQTSNANGGQTNFGPKMPPQWQQQNAANRAENVREGAAAGTRQFNYDAAKVPSAPQTVEVTAAAPKLETSQTEMRASRQIPSPSQPSEQQFDLAPGPVKAKPAVNAVHGATFDRAIPRWAISSAGGLERSYDQGNTWQNVDVAASATPWAGGAAIAVLAKSVPAVPPSKEKDVYKKTPAAPSPAPVFRAVAATGADVWVGGSNGALFHSVDDGNHWMQVVPSAAGATLSGDIVRLEFSDVQHGTVITSTAQVWTTGDDGQTWQKQ